MHFILVSDDISQITFGKRINAVLQLDKKLLPTICKKSDSLGYSLLFIFISIVMDFVGLQGFNFRFELKINDQLSPLYFIIQPLSLVFLAFATKLLLKLDDPEITYTTVFNGIGQAHIWTIASGFILIIMNFIPPSAISVIIGIASFLVFMYLYCATILFSFKSYDQSLHKIFMPYLLGIAYLIIMFLIFGLFAILFGGVFS